MKCRRRPPQEFFLSICDDLLCTFSIRWIALPLRCAGPGLIHSRGSGQDKWAILPACESLFQSLESSGDAAIARDIGPDGPPHHITPN